MNIIKNIIIALQVYMLYFTKTEDARSVRLVDNLILIGCRFTTYQDGRRVRQILPGDPRLSCSLTLGRIELRLGGMTS